MLKNLKGLAGIICVLVLAACAGNGGGDTPATVDDTPAVIGDNVTLNVAIWDTNQAPGLTEIMDIFTERTGIQIELQVLTWGTYWTFMEAGAIGGDLPDVFWMHSGEVQRYMDAGMLLDLTSWIADSDYINLANYPQGVVNLYTWEGRNYAVPKDVDTIAIFYNRTMFEQAGVPTPQPGWTWEDLLEKAIALTDPEAGIYGFALPPSNGQAGWYNIIYAWDGYVINNETNTSGLNDPNTIAAMEFFESIIHAGVMPSLENMVENQPEVLFVNGIVAMVPEGSWMVPFYRDNEFSSEHANIAVMPQGPGGRHVSIFNGLGWSAASATDHPYEAWRLIEWFGSEEAQLMQAELGVTMSAFHGTSEAWANAVPHFNLQAYLDMMNDMVFRPYSRNTIVWNQSNEMGLVPVFMGEMSMRDALEQMYAQMSQALAQE